MSKNKRSLFKRILRWTLYVILGLLLTLTAYYFLLPNVCALEKKNPTTTAFMEIRKQEAATAQKRFVIKHQWVPLSRISKLLVEAVLNAEDDRFYEHEGVDWLELQKAFEKRSAKKGMRGASTISQQLVKNLYLSPERSLLRKLKELLLTFKLERCLSKQRILECYLNVIELGPGIFGVEAASRTFFNKSALSLSSEEILRLVAVIPKPLNVSPLSNGKYLAWRIRWIGGRLVQKGLLSEAELLQILGHFQ